MSVLINGVNWPPETFITRLIDGLLNAGIHITIATTQRPDKAWLERDGFSWLYEPAWEGNHLLRLLRLGMAFVRTALMAQQDLRIFLHSANQETSRVAFLRILQRLLPYAGRRWDVIYFPWNSGAVERLALFELSVPVVISCRGAQVNIAPYNPERIDFRKGLKTSFEKAAYVHCVSKNILDEAEKFGLAVEKAKIIHPAVDIHFFKPPALKTTSTKIFRIVSIGALIWRKGYEYALTALHRIKVEGIPVHYQIIGDGPDRQRILYTIHDLGLQDTVQLMGRQPPAAVRDLLQQADVFLHASLSEGIANVVLEAMACGLPVVVTDCGGMREAVSNGIEGFVTAVRDPQGLACALENLWRDPDLRQEMGQQARSRAVSEFSLDRQIIQFQKLFTGMQIKKTIKHE